MSGIQIPTVIRETICNFKKIFSDPNFLATIYIN